MSEFLIEATALSKTYGAKTVLSAIDLNVLRGQLIAFVGHNGSGKSTLLKILAGLTAITSGRIERKPGMTVGYVPEHFPASSLTATQYLRHMARIEGMNRLDATRVPTELAEAFFVADWMDVPMAHLSKGSLRCRLN